MSAALCGQPYDAARGEIHQSIEAMDREGMLVRGVACAHMQGWGRGFRGEGEHHSLPARTAVGCAPGLCEWLLCVCVCWPRVCVRRVQLIESRDPDAFREYLKRTRNTICGRHPITVMLEAMIAAGVAPSASVKFVRYAQSSACRTQEDSSVSYASAVIAF
jgi:hypothetical protein